MEKKNLWIVMPCFFDVDCFLKTREEVLKSVAAFSSDLVVNFLLIDDSAGADLAVRKLPTDKNLKKIYMPYNLGHQGAIVYALRTLGKRVSSDDYLVTMDSDGEDKPEHVVKLLKALIEKDSNLHQVILAKRTFRKETLGFKIGYFCFKNCFRLLTGQEIKNGNFAAFRGIFLKEIIYHPHFDQCYSSSFISLPLQIDFIPLERGYRFFGTTKMGYMNLISHGLRMMMPFTERIAIRGVVASGALALLSVISLVAFLFISSNAAILSFLCFFFITLIAGLFTLLFATFSQSKATSLSRMRQIGTEDADPILDT